jgi:hypothetical protein
MKKKLFQNFSLFSPVSLTPLINIHLWISPWIFEKIRNGPNGILRGPGDTDLWKKSDVENLVSDSLYCTGFTILNLKQFAELDNFFKSLCFFILLSQWEWKHDQRHSFQLSSLPQRRNSCLLCCSYLDSYDDYEYYYDTSLNQIDYWEFIGKYSITCSHWSVSKD